MGIYRHGPICRSFSKKMKQKVPEGHAPSGFVITQGNLIKKLPNILIKTTKIQQLAQQYNRIIFNIAVLDLTQLGQFPNFLLKYRFQIIFSVMQFQYTTLWNTFIYLKVKYYLLFKIQVDRNTEILIKVSVISLNLCVTLSIILI